MELVISLGVGLAVGVLLIGFVWASQTGGIRRLLKIGNGRRLLKPKGKAKTGGRRRRSRKPKAKSKDKVMPEPVEDPQTPIDTSGEPVVIEHEPTPEPVAEAEAATEEEPAVVSFAMDDFADDEEEIEVDPPEVVPEPEPEPVVRQEPVVVNEVQTIGEMRAAEREAQRMVEPTAPTKHAISGGRRLAMMLFPWIMPPHLKKTDDMTLEELVDEAHGDRPLLREFGWRDSAVFHPDEMNIQYMRTLQYLGRFPVKVIFVQWIITAGVAFGLGLLMLLGPSQEAEDLAAGKWLNLSVGFIVGMIFGPGVAYSTRTTMQFALAYATARIAQKVSVNGVRRTVAIYELPLRRLVFANRHGEHFFSGIESHSGFAGGRMNLETELELTKVTDPRQFYAEGAVKPCVSSFTGVNSSRRHALNGDAKEAGRINAEKQLARRNNGLDDWIAEHKGLTFFAISVAVAGLLLAVGVEIDPTQASSMFGGGK